MEREIGLKPRESKDLPAEKLFEVLCQIYPKETAQELFQKLQGDGSDGQKSR